ncbi:MAG: DUF4435 domain-containing protein [Chitinophagales bacterium]
MKYDLFELLNVAITMNKSFLLVEGKDDKQIYARIAKKANKDFDIYLINSIEEYAEGCDSVIKALAKLQPKFLEREDNIQRVMGIIDRDSRSYRTLHPHEIDYQSLKGLFVLKHYSIETYFATRTNLKKIIEKVTYLSSDMVTDEILNVVEMGFQKSKEELYFLSLEALKNACIEEYEAVLGYENDSVKDYKQRQRLYLQVIGKIEELEVFAQEKNLTIDNLKEVCKGKWFLHIFLKKCLEQIKTLSEMCRKGEIQQCKSCKVGIFTDCSYKAKKGYKAEGLCNDVLEYVDEVECVDIIERFKELI